MVYGPSFWLLELEENAGYHLLCCYNNEAALSNLPAWEALSILVESHYVANTLGKPLLIQEEF